MSRNEEPKNESSAGEQSPKSGKSFVLLLAVFFAGIIFAGLVYLLSDKWQYEPVVVHTAEVKQSIGFSIYGAVSHPGEYVSAERLRVSTAAALAGGLSDNADLPSAGLSVWVHDGDTVIIPTFGGTEPTMTPMSTELPLIDINQATAEDWMSLPGIGEKKAADILALRAEKKRFHSVDELLEVKGISQNLLENIYDRLTVE